MKTEHTQGQLKAIDGALLCDEVNNYGNFIVADCRRERTSQDDANLERLAACWNACDGLNPEAIPALVEALSRLANAVEAHRETFTTDNLIELSEAEDEALAKARP